MSNAPALFWLAAVPMWILTLSHAPSAAAAIGNQKARAYSEHNHLPPPHEVVIDLPQRQIVRSIVLVTPQSHPDFVARFTDEGSVLLRQTATNHEHPTLVLSQTDVRTYGLGQIDEPSAGGVYLGVGLAPEKRKYLETNLDKTPITDHAGCMYWLVDAKVAPDEYLAHALGVTRSMASSNLVKKLIHAGTDVVLGIPQGDEKQVTELRNLIGHYRANPGILDPARAKAFIEASEARLPLIEAMSEPGGFGRLEGKRLLGVPPGGGTFEAVHE